MRILARLAPTIAAAALFAGCGSAQKFVAPPPTFQARLGAGEATARIVTLKRKAKGPGYKVMPPLLYVANSTHAYDGVNVYRANAKDPHPLATITDGVINPGGVCLDSVGTLYVTNQPASGPGWISEYSLGKTAPTTTITDGINGPAFCAIDANGNLWVTNIGLDDVAVYPKGATQPKTILTNGLTRPTGIAIDDQGNIYVGNLLTSVTSNVVVYAPGDKSPSRTITEGITYPTGMAVDSKGTLYVTNLEQNNIEEYRAGRDKPFRTVTETTGHGPSDVALNKYGRLYVSNFLDNTVAEFRAGSLKPSRRQISKEVWAPGGLAYYPAVLP
jgi:sugar lactone lactonase YvrE